jgi:hypothetical protein
MANKSGSWVLGGYFGLHKNAQKKASLMEA